MADRRAVPEATDVTPSLLPFVRRLRVWSDDDLHVLRSARSHEPVYANPAELRKDVRDLLERLAYEESRVSQAYGAPWPEHDRTIEEARQICPEAVKLLESRIAYLVERFDGHQRIIRRDQDEAFRLLGRVRRNVSRAWRYRKAVA
jgi:hypothetical protein